ncbi:MAG: extracellular solute-binding protein, partial [Ruminococcaceae bacterium]|nr:extracellular solute-binding protein [Oscillospiraceae bacterium]
FSLGSGTDSLELMRTEMNARQKPAIFCIMSPAELGEWVEGGFARPLSEAISEEFRTLAAEIPAAFALTDGINSYGIPFNVEGYGYVTDTQMLSDIFGDGDAVAAAMREASWEEWEALVSALTAYIESDLPSTVTLAGETFTMNPGKSGRAGLLEGVFATAGSQPWTYGDHMANIALNAVFEGPADALRADEQTIRSLTGALTAYARALDLKTANAVTPRGPAFINSTTGGYDASVEDLASGRAIFLKQGNWVEGNFASSSNPGIVNSLTLIPVKLPLTDADVKASGRTVESINRSIPVYVPNYYVINAKVDEQQQEWAERFLVWLNTSETGQRFVTREMRFIPYNAEPGTLETESSLARSIVGYIQRGEVLSNPYAGAPSGWSNTGLGQYVMETYLTRAEWDEDVYADIARYGVEEWLARRG